MAKVVHKFSIDKGSSFTAIEIPSGAKILKAGIQGNQIVLWAVVESPAELRETRVFSRILTGDHFAYNEANHKLDYISTVTDNQGIVYHIFEYVEIKQQDQYTF